ncbi:ASTRA complex subunit [Tulasnella sp. 427]|nr:ASTRA complex subunit [Tulasnella sp. 427]
MHLPLSTTTSLPVISVIEPTPLKSLQSKHLTNQHDNPTPTSSRHSQTPRLLYTGSLALGDQNVGVSLDGICFVAHAPPTSPTAFLSSPLPLALEMMRGRPSLRVLSIIPLATVQARFDDTADVRLYWRPDAYFAHEFFIKSLWKAGGWDSEGRSNQCLKVALGDEGISEEDEIIIYGQSLTLPSAVRFCVTRLLPQSSMRRLPRPDDPRPRQPPAVFASPGRKGNKRMLRAHSPEKEDERFRKKGRILSNSGVSASQMKRARTTSALPFKGGSLPSFSLAMSRKGSNLGPPSGSSSQLSSRQNSREGLSRTHSRTSSVSSVMLDDDDVFKAPEPVSATRELFPRAPLRRTDTSSSLTSLLTPQETLMVTVDPSELEQLNKNVIKKSAKDIMIKRGYPLEDPEHREIWNWVQRGVAFAMRKSIQSVRVERSQVQALVTKHLDMYTDALPPLPQRLLSGRGRKTGSRIDGRLGPALSRLFDMGPPPPPPIRILRSHAAQINAVTFSPLDPEGKTNERLYTGDGDGLVVITSTSTFRALASWKAHDNGILEVKEWEDSVITHGRDNKIHVWERVVAPLAVADMAGPELGVTGPSLRYSLDVNALNFCRFSLLPEPPGTGGRRALIAIPNLVDSSLVDVWRIPEKQRLHAAIGMSVGPKIVDPWVSGEGPGKTGSLMSLRLFSIQHPSRSNTSQLRLLTAYENGGLCLWVRMETEKETSVEGRGWEALWQVKVHADAIFAMEMSPLNTFAITASADNLLVRYDLQDNEENAQGRTATFTHRTKHPGNGTIAISHDGRVCVVGGWDGKIRLYSTKNFKFLGLLDYHKGVLQCVTLASLDGSPSSTPDRGEDNSEELELEERQKRSRWLASTGVDKRVAIWELMDFASSSSKTK